MGVMVSVVIPVYNSEKCLRGCLESLCGQSLENIEMICVNDGSTDGSWDIIREYSARDKRVIGISQENAGAGTARNNGMRRAAGKYIIFLDSDDVFEKTMLEMMANRLESTSADAAMCLADSFDNATGRVCSGGWTMPRGLLGGDDVFSPADKKDVFFQTMQGWPWDKMFRREFIREHGIEYPDLPNSQDLVFNLRAMALAGRVCFVDRILVHRRVNRSASISNSRAASFDSPYKAVRMLCDMLRADGVYDTFRYSLDRWSLNFLLWHLRTLGGEPQKQVYRLFREQWSRELGFDNIPRETCNENDFNEYTAVMHSSYRKYIMSKKIKNALKKILPPPKSAFDRESRLTADNIAALRSELSAGLCAQDARIAELSAENERLRGEVERLSAIVEKNEK